MKQVCCGYGAKHANTKGYDCAIIPAPSKADTGAALMNAWNGFCGGELGTIADSIVTKTICCKYCTLEKDTDLCTIAGLRKFCSENLWNELFKNH